MSVCVILVQNICRNIWGLICMQDFSQIVNPCQVQFIFGNLQTFLQFVGRHRLLNPFLLRYRPLFVNIAHVMTNDDPAKSWCISSPGIDLQSSTPSFLAGCPKSHFLGCYRNFLVYWYLKLDNQVVNSTCPKDKLGWIWWADDFKCTILTLLE